MSPNHGLTQEELDALTPEEREALTAELSESEDYLAKGGAGVSADADPFEKPKTEIVDDDEDEEGNEGDGKKAAAAPAGEAAKGADTPADEPQGSAEQTEPGEREPLAVPYQAPAVDQAKVKTALEDLKKKFDEQEITLEEYLEKRDAIKEAVFKDGLSREHHAQTELRLWEDAVDTFLERHPEYKDAVLYQTLDGVIKMMASDTKQFGHLSNRQLIDKAHEEVAKRFKVPAGAAEGAAEAKPDPAKDLATKRKPDLSQVPKTLASVPAAAPQNVEGDEFAHIEALQRKAEAGDADAQAGLERALARLTPEQQDRFLSAA